MKTAKPNIIKWLSNGIKPTQVKYTVMNALQAKDKNGEEARRKRLTTFHRLLKGLLTN